MRRHSARSCRDFRDAILVMRPSGYAAERTCVLLDKKTGERKMDSGQWGAKRTYILLSCLVAGSDGDLITCPKGCAGGTSDV